MDTKGFNLSFSMFSTYSMCLIHCFMSHKDPYDSQLKAVEYSPSEEKETVQ